MPFCSSTYHRSLKLSLLAWAMLVSAVAMAQRTPVNASLSILPPFSTQYAPFVSPAGNKMQAMFTLTDLQEPSVDVRFAVQVQGNSLRLQTREDYMPPVPITLFPGAPVVVDGTEWAQYFDPQNLVFSGVGRESFIQTGKFPEGMYTFTIVAKEYASGKVISREVSTMIWLKLNDQPTLISPQTGTAIAIAGPQNIFFQWQLNSPSASGIPFTPMYRFFLYEMINQEVDPIYALQNGQTILVYESPELMTPSLNYTLANPLLDLGKKYMFRVQAFDPAGENEFRDNGFSPPGWFYYGFPTDGVITLNNPKKDYVFKKTDAQNLEFTAPSKLVRQQQFRYRLKVVELASKTDDPELAMLNNAAWHEVETPPTTNTRSYALNIDQKAKPFKPSKHYAWQVTAFSGDQEIAKSEIGIFSGPPLAESIRVGNHTLAVTELLNDDLNALKGKGIIKIFQLGDSVVNVEVAFDKLKITKSGGYLVLDDGEVDYTLEKPLELSLVPKEKANMKGTFVARQVKLNRNGLLVSGHFEVPFPHAVKSGEKAMVRTKTDWVDFNRYLPYGEMQLSDQNRFELLDPFGFTMLLDEKSTIVLLRTEYEMKLNGHVDLSHTLNATGSNLQVPFTNQGQLLYLTENVRLPQAVGIVPNTSLAFNTSSYTIDLSEQLSPDKMGSKAWKGIYFNELEFKFDKDIDASKQLAFTRQLDYKVNQNVRREVKAYIGSQGLDFAWSEDMKGAQIATFNGFQARIKELKLEVERSVVRNSHVKGSIAIPVIDPTADFGFTSQITHKGVQAGYLDQSLEGLAFDINPYGGENRVEVKVKRAVFEQSDRLNLTADFTIPALNVTAENTKDFHIYSDNFIGFGKRNGATLLPSAPKGSYNGMDLTLTQLGASLSSAKYVFSYSVIFNMGEGFAGADGSMPVSTFHSIVPVSEEIRLAAIGTEIPSAIPLPNLQAKYDAGTLELSPMNISYKSGLADFTATVKLDKNDPKWGTVFRGKIQGELKQPTRVALGGELVYGKKGFDYFYLDAFYVDEGGIGVTVFPGVNLVGFEGWLFSNMNVDKDQKLVLDRANGLGYNFFGQFIDTKRGGGVFQLDGALEYRSKSNDIKVSGDISFLNLNTRSAKANEVFAEKAKGELKEEAARQALKVLGDIDEEITLAGGRKLRFRYAAERASVELSNNGNFSQVYGDLANVPTLGLGLSVGTGSAKATLNARNAIGLTFTKDNVSASMDYMPIKGSAFSLKDGPMKVSALANKETNDAEVGYADNGGEHLVKGIATANQVYYKYNGGSTSFTFEGNIADKQGVILAQTGSTSAAAQVKEATKEIKLGYSFAGSPATLVSSVNGADLAIDYSTGQSLMRGKSTASGTAFVLKPNGATCTMELVRENAQVKVQTTADCNQPSAAAYDHTSAKLTSWKMSAANTSWQSTTNGWKLGTAGVDFTLVNGKQLQITHLDRTLTILDISKLTAISMGNASPFVLNNELLDWSAMDVAAFDQTTNKGTISLRSAMGTDLRLIASEGLATIALGNEVSLKFSANGTLAVESRGAIKVTTEQDALGNFVNFSATNPDGLAITLDNGLQIKRGQATVYHSQQASQVLSPIAGNTLTIAGGSWQFAQVGGVSMSMTPQGLYGKWENAAINMSADTLLGMAYPGNKFAYLAKDPGFPNFQPGVYNLSGGKHWLFGHGSLLSFATAGSKGESPQRSIGVTGAMELVYDEYGNDPFRARLGIPEGYKAKLNLTDTKKNVGGGVGLLMDGSIQTELSSDPMNLMAMRLKLKGKEIEKIEILASEKITGNLLANKDGVADLVPSSIDGAAYDAYFAKEGGSIEINGKYLMKYAGTGGKAGENLAGSPDITLQGPKYIGTISDKANGAFRGQFKLIKTGQNSIMMTGNASGNNVVEVSGAFEYKASAETWSYKIGTPSEKVKIKTPVTSFDGFLAIDPSELNVGFGVRSKFEQDYDLTDPLTKSGLGVSIYADFYLDAAFVAGLNPIEFREFSFDGGVAFKLDGRACLVGGCKSATLLGVRFSGTMKGSIYDRTISGNVSGSATILGINTGTLNYSAEVKL